MIFLKKTISNLINILEPISGPWESRQRMTSHSPTSWSDCGRVGMVGAQQNFSLYIAHHGQAKGRWLENRNRNEPYLRSLSLHAMLTQRELMTIQFLFTRRDSWRLCSHAS